MGKKTGSSTNSAGSTGSQHAEECKLILSYLIVKCSSPSGHKIRYIETNTTENGEELRTYRQRGNFPEQRTNGLCSKIKNQQMEPHEIAKLLQGKGQNSN